MDTQQSDTRPTGSGGDPRRTVVYVVHEGSSRTVYLAMEKLGEYYTGREWRYNRTQPERGWTSRTGEYGYLLKRKWEGDLEEVTDLPVPVLTDDEMGPVPDTPQVDRFIQYQKAMFAISATIPVPPGAETIPEGRWRTTGE